MSGRKMLLSEILKNCKDDLEITNFKDIQIEGIDRNSLNIKKNYIFCVIDGRNNKGENFIKSSIENGAVVIISEKHQEIDNLVVIKTKENVYIKDIYGKILMQFYNNEIPEHIIGVTGTCGKTSIVEYIRQAIQYLGFNSASNGSLGIKYGDKLLECGDSLTMRETSDMYQKFYFLKHEEKINYLSMEFTSHGLDQDRAVGIHPEIGIFTNFSQEHLDYHPDKEHYFESKMILFKKTLKKGSTAILNADIPEFDTIKKICEECGHNIISYGKKGDIKIIDIINDKEGQKVLFNYLGKEYILKTKLIGDFQIMNLLASFGALISLFKEIDIQKIIDSLEKVKNAEGRMDFVCKKKNGGSIYIDYSHKPDALEKILKAVKVRMELENKDKLILLFGCGGDRDKGKRPLMGEIANKYADVVFITDDNPRGENPEEIRKEIHNKCPKAYNIGDRKIAIEKAIDILGPNDVLILAGKGHEKYILYADKKLPFDEKKIVIEYINKGV